MATPIAAALLVQSIARVAGTTLTRSSIFPKVATTDYENQTFEVGETTTIRVARTQPAINFDPRVAPFTPSEGTYASDTIVLERLWTNGFKTYSHDAPEAIKKYIVETGNQCAKGIAPQNDTYMYQKFRTIDTTSGAVQYFANAPLAIVANVDATGNFTVFNSDIVTNAGAVLDIANVPPDDRYVVMSSMAKAAFLKDAIRVTGFAQGFQGSGKIIETGLANEQFVPTYGFNCGASNTVSGQTAVADMDTAAGTQSELPVASIAQDTTKYFDSQVSTTTPLGAVDITLTASTALNIGAGGVAVGQIAQIRTTGNVPKAHMVILRIASAGTTAPVITGVPYSPSGQLLTAADFVAGDKLRIPAIGSVNVANHKQGLLLSSRPIRLPAADSGAVGSTFVEPETQIAINIIKGVYDGSTISQNINYHALLGAKFANWKMGALMLTA